MICPKCCNTGTVGDRYCDCAAAIALRARIDADPRIEELRARIEQNLGERSPLVFVRSGGVSVLHPTSAIDAVEAYEAAGVTWSQLRAVRRRPPD